MNGVKIAFLLGALLIGLASFRNNSVTQYSSAKPPFRADTLKKDAESGLIDAPNLMMVKAQCTACHSSKLILQHRFTRAGWVDRIRWMQKYHKLWDLGESEKVVLDYLETYYGPASMSDKGTFRRPPMKQVKWYKLEP
ncbi:hypothetical protein [Spirosoma spitsbergense]|jgi:hypothetical protein|uniref:hypothetical protein n=1 Tax=Spirosoma spitsbergense TaxID=431554 RepID=UPI00035D8FBF|nr:hypothetical protein [Spirosoma spitsbergense]